MPPPSNEAVRSLALCKYPGKVEILLLLRSENQTVLKTMGAHVTLQLPYVCAAF